jgi:predicted DNA-binding transcriptional regulator YafY
MPRISQALPELLKLFQNGEAFSTKIAAGRLNVDPRHVRRLIETLIGEGYPLERVKEGRRILYRIPPERIHVKVEPPALDTYEALAISVAAGAANAFLNRTPLREALLSGFRKLVDHLAPAFDLIDLDRQVDLWYFQSLAQTRMDRAVFTELLRAINDYRSIRIDYEHSDRPLDRNRRVDPLAFGVIGNTVLLAAYCHRRQGVRDFSLARIRAVHLCDPEVETNAYFDPPNHFETTKHFRHGRFAAMAGGDIHVYRIRVAPTHAHHFHEHEYHFSQDIEHTEADGTLIVSYEGASFEEFRSFFQGWGAAITVEEPAEMVERLRLDAEILAQRYANTSTPRT